MSRSKTRVTAPLTAAISVWLVHRFMFPPSEAQAHERAWRDARNKIRDQAYDNSPSSAWDYLRPRTWLWYWQGKPDRDRVWQQFTDQEKELIRLGVLVSETVVLTNRTYHETMTNPSSFLNGSTGTASEDSSGVALHSQQEIVIVGKPAWVRNLAIEFQKWDSEKPARNKQIGQSILPARRWSEEAGAP
jgi:hypothetical protein